MTTNKEKELKVGDKIRVVQDNEFWNGVEGTVDSIVQPQAGVLKTTVWFEITKKNPRNSFYPVGKRAGVYLENVELVEDNKLPREIAFDKIRKGDRLRITDETNSASDIKMVSEGVAYRKRKASIKFQEDDYAWMTSKGCQLIDGIRASHDNVTIELLDRPKSAVDNMPVGTTLAVRVNNDLSMWDVYTKTDEDTWSTVHVELWEGTVSVVGTKLFSEFVYNKAWKTIYRPADK